MFDLIVYPEQLTDSRVAAMLRARGRVGVCARSNAEAVPLEAWLDARARKLPAMPEFDPRRDGNPFRWIVRMAPKVRAQRQAALGYIRLAIHGREVAAMAAPADLGAA